MVSGKNIPLLGLLVLSLLVLPPLTARARGEGGFSKIFTPGLEEKLQGQDRIRVMALLKGYRNPEALSLSSSGRTQMARLRAEALLGLSPDEAGPGSQPLNFPVLNLEVTAKGLAQLQASGLVEAIQEDRPLELHTAQGLDLMRAAPIRSQYGGDNVSIALIDTGVDYTHPALGGTEQGYGTFPNAKILGGYDFGESDSDPMDNDGHGTSVAALARRSGHPGGGLHRRGGPFGGAVHAQGLPGRRDHLLLGSHLCLGTGS